MDPSSAPDPARWSSSAPGRLVGRVGGHTFVYGLTAATGVVAGLGSVVVLTRYLAPASFGRLAVLLVTQSLLLLVYNAGSLQGTVSWVYGMAGGDDDVGDDEPDAPGAHDRRRALATGLLLTAVVGASGTGIVLAVSEPAADLLLGDRGAGGLLVLAAGGAGLAAVWRVAGNALRLERRPWGYLLSTAAQHLLGLAFAIPLLAAGEGIGGVLGGIAAGNLCALGIALWLIRRGIRPAVSWTDAKAIMRRGRPLIPVVASVHFIQLADVLILSYFVPSAQVGLYRIANRIGALVSYWTASFHMAWGPLRRDAVHLAVDAEFGRGRVAAVVTTYFVLVTTGVVLAATVLADALVRLAAPAYASAASLIPLTAAGFAFHGLYVLAYRIADFPKRRAWFVGLTIASAIVFAGSVFVLIPLTGRAGAALAVIAGWLAGTLGMLLRGQLGARPGPLQWRRMAAGVAVAAACALTGRLAGSGWSAQALAVDLGVLAAYPVLLVALGIVPWGHVGVLARGVDPRGWRRPAPALPAALAPEQRTIVDLLLGQRRGVSDVARMTGLSDEEVLRRLVDAVRSATVLREPRDWDAALGRHLLLDGGFAEVEASARALYAAGADPLEVEALVAVASRVRAESAPPPPAPSTSMSAGAAPGPS
jgi:O-antigen/teichoic acid export membrane protein